VVNPANAHHLFLHTEAIYKIKWDSLRSIIHAAKEMQQQPEVHLLEVNFAITGFEQHRRIFLV
jgi:hypothetical protein